MATLGRRCPFEAKEASGEAVPHSRSAVVEALPDPAGNTMAEPDARGASSTATSEAQSAAQPGGAAATGPMAGPLRRGAVATSRQALSTAPPATKRPCGTGIRPHESVEVLNLQTGDDAARQVVNTL